MLIRSCFDLKNSDDFSLFLGPIIFVGLLSIAFYCCGLFYLYGNFPDGLADANREDLVTYYRIGEMLAKGQITEVFQLEQFHAGLKAKFHYLLALNPPSLFFVTEFFYSIGYSASKVLILAACVVCSLLIGTIAGRSIGAALLVAISSMTAYSLISLNISIFIILMIVFAVTCAGRYPILSGIALALATFKPQYGLLLPVFLISCGHWRAFWSASLATAVLITGSALTYGFDAWIAFITMFSDPGYQNHIQGAINAFMSVHHALAKVGVSVVFREVAQAALILFSMGLIVYGARYWDRKLLCAITLYCSGLVSPSLFCYDWGLFYASFLMLMQLGKRWPVWFQFMAAYVWCEPTIKFALAHTGPQVINYYSASIPLTNLLVLGAILRVFAFPGGRTATQGKQDAVSIV
ncbi:MAG: DUF2029 domain-containing protein [Rhodobacteraceae bacterium]|nr:DUF2029 domain-containing protein [Paracoccaceae bacterium]